MTAHGESPVNNWLDKSLLEQIRMADLTDRRARSFVEDQQEHTDPQVAAHARHVLGGERSVASLVDLVIEQGQFAFDAVKQAVNGMDPELLDDLRRRTGTDAASLRERLKPEPYEPSAEVHSYLEQSGVRSLPSLDELKARLGVDPYAVFDLDGLEERQRGQTAPRSSQD